MSVSGKWINPTNAILGGNISDDGGSSVTSRGVCYNTTGNPTTSNPRTIDGTGTGTFAKVSGTLLQNTTYYIRAYAFTSIGTSYGEEKTFTTLP